MQDKLEAELLNKVQMQSGLGQIDPNDTELLDVQESLRDIDQIMIAETKRRIESNQIMSEFIDDYLKTLNERITSKVDQEFQELK
tara:strand:- start:551 stop:805 length:255 start_codon:yes stop_codon:yes gene_type:complete